jgi:predicted lipid-binding transport protein (Tim44 family)
MTADEFLHHISKDIGYRDKGKARLNRARQHYAMYVKAYRAATLEELLHVYHTDWAAARAAARDRDEGRPMVSVPELL